MDNIGVEELILSDEDAEAAADKIAILTASVQYFKQLFDNPEESTDMGGAISKYLFGQDWELMDISEKIAAVGNLTLNTLSDIDKIISNTEDQQLMDFRNNVSKKKELLNAQLNDGAISYEEYTARTAQLDEDLDTKQRKLAHDQAVRQKSIAVMSAILNTAVAVVKALAFGPPLGYVFAGISAALGAIQIGIAASQPVPQYATGNRAQIIGNQDGKTYNAKVVSSNHPSGLYSEPTYVPGFGLFGETPRPELVFNPYDTQMIMNSPALIDAINHTIQPQYASGNAETMNGGSSNTTDTSAAMLSMLAKIEQKLGQPAQAILVADEDYSRTHNKVQNNYNSFQNKVN